ncbi:Hypothetical predicted protein [Lecanosticta acicola]|uniref:DUF7730 domain-containing protein n=1 Tax=Lecanosticta acicola TaxID=111012 RepID=A0AAI8Z730_9PEZI|nr:Hypothetical predicted protein [Lecanosticta acicola]
MFSPLALFDNPYQDERTHTASNAINDHRSMTYPDRLATFSGYWDNHQTAARQLAALGHICDRPPIEAIEEGSHCISCNIFVPKAQSIRALEGPLCRTTSNGDNAPTIPNLHHPNCLRLQVRIPLENQTVLTGSLSGYHHHHQHHHHRIRNNHTTSGQDSIDKRHPPSSPPQHPNPQPQQSPFFSLPTELRLQIYAYILPQMAPTTHMLPRTRDSTTLTTHMAYQQNLSSSSSSSHSPSTLPLLSTCRAIHTEALPLLFPPTTTYRLPSTKEGYLFLRHLGHAGRQHLHSVDVACGQREDAVAFALLASCPRLRNLTIRLPRPVLLPPLPRLWVLDGVACLLELHGLESVTFGPCGGMLPGLDESKADAVLLREKLMRPRGQGSGSGVRWVDGYLDL